MKKMTPMILVILMLTSFLSTVDVYELQEESNNEETSARAGADPALMYITSPRETNYVAGEATNPMLAGEPVNFKAYVKNAGDADLTNMQYTVTVYRVENGQLGAVATDSNGNDLIWQNDKAICTSNCQNSVLASGEYLDGGESTLRTTNDVVIEWTPTSGNYIVEVKLTSQVLGDPGNDELTIPVTVKDYSDIVVDVTWLDDNGMAVPGAIEGTDAVDVKVTVNLESSIQTVNVRNLTIAVTTTVDDDTNDYFTEVIGELKTVDISQDDEANTIPGQRIIIGSDGNKTNLNKITGESTFNYQPPSDGPYEVSVTLESYTVYEESEECDDGTTPTIMICERLVAGTDAEDEYSGNNFDSVYGSATTVHDIALGAYYIVKVPVDDGEKVDDDTETEDTWGSLGSDISEPLSVGEYTIVTDVIHRSSSSTPVYDWNVTFTLLNTDTQTTTVVHSDSCQDYLEYNHTYLGVPTDKTDASTIGYACTVMDLAQGNYVLEAEANMLGQYDENTLSMDNKISDMVEVNNDYEFNFEVLNYAPQILSVKTDVFNASYGDEMTLTAVSFDVEGDKLTHTWYDGAGAPLTCGSNGDTGDVASCTITLTEVMVPNLRVRLVVSDGVGDAEEYIDVPVFATETFTASGLADGYAAVYSMTAKGSGLTVTFADGPLDAVSIAQCANDATPVGSIEVTPSTTYQSSDLVSQSITIHFPNDLGIQYLWMKAQGLVSEIASGEGSEVIGQPSTSGYTYNFPSGADSIASGTVFYLIADDCDTPEPPTGAITQLVATPGTAGTISIVYNYNNLQSDETVKIVVCKDSADCATPEIEYSRVEDDTRSVTYNSDTHDQFYEISASLCNQYSCGTAVVVNATADSLMDAVTATSITISESGENWLVDWESDVVSDDVAGWYVCYNRGEFTASEMSLMIDSGTCTMVMDGTEATIAKYTSVETTEVFFGIVPHDAVMNIAYGPSTDSILYDRAQDTTNPGDGDTITDTDDASSGVPTWTWGVIGAVVVVAFVVGAFILSRGEGEDDDDKEWDY